MENTTNNTDQAVKPEAGVAKSEGENKFKKFLKKVNWKITSIVVIIVVAVAGLGYYYKGLVIAAVVNGKPITRVSIIKQLEKQSGQALLEQMIDQKLIDQEAQKKNIAVSDDDVNKELSAYKSQVESGGQNFDDALASQGLTEDDLKGEIKTELALEKLLGDKVAVTDDEVNQYIKDNNVTLPAGQEDATKAQIKASLVQQKVSDQAPDYINSLKSQSKIYTWVNY